MKGVAVLGSTGSIGVSTLDVLARHPDRYRVVALTAHRNVGRLIEQCRQHRPAYAVIVDKDEAAHLRQAVDDLRLPTRVLSGKEALDTIASLEEVDHVMAAIVGAAGLQATLSAARAGKRILLANKEALVMSGRLLIDTAREHGAELLPIDSEHNAIFQCLPPKRHVSDDGGVTRILLTASGGPFLRTPASELADVTPEQACNHPNWDMGRKISVDSATMMNKGLEVIEACLLFDTDPDKVQVVVHPQSIVHSLVQYVDGSVLAQLGNPDMRTPIAHALAWPGRIDAGVTPLDLPAVGRLEFEAPDQARFPCLRLAFEAIRHGATMPAVLNAANEVAVEAFLDRRLGFDGIPMVIEQVMSKAETPAAASLDEILAVDRQAREQALQVIGRMQKGTGT